MNRSRLRLPVVPAVLAAAAFAAAACSAGHSAANGTGRARFAVTSTLDGLTALPHRVHWQAFPHPAANVAEVDFLIDGKQFWVEHNTPYFYGDDGNYLVTTFLAAGPHAFTVRAIDLSGHEASDTVTASVPVAPLPPQALAGTWRGYSGSMTAGSCQPGPCPPAGYWRLVISRIGWQVYDTAGGGGLYDVAYLSPGLAEVRTGMSTGHPDTDGSAWCTNKPGSPVRVRWTVDGHLLSFIPVGNQAGSCGFTGFLRSRTGHRAVPWTKVGS